MIVAVIIVSLIIALLYFWHRTYCHLKECQGHLKECQERLKTYQERLQECQEDLREVTQAKDNVFELWSKREQIYLDRLSYFEEQEDGINFEAVCKRITPYQCIKEVPRKILESPDQVIHLQRSLTYELSKTIAEDLLKYNLLEEIINVPPSHYWSREPLVRLGIKAYVALIPPKDGYKLHPISYIIRKP